MRDTRTAANVRAWFLGLLGALVASASGVVTAPPCSAQQVRQADPATGGDSGDQSSHAQRDEAQDQPPTPDPQQSARGQIAQRLEQLREQLAAATEAGKQELVQHLKQEIDQYVTSKAHEQIEQTRQRAEELVREQYDLAEQRIQQLREQGGTALPEKWLSRARTLLHSRQRAAELAERQAAAQVLNRDIGNLLAGGQHDLARQRTEQLALLLDQLAWREQAPDPAGADALPLDAQDRLQRRLYYLRAASSDLVQLEMFDLAQQLHDEAAQVQRALQQQPAPRPLEPEAIVKLQREFQAVSRRLDTISRQLQQLAPAASDAEAAHGDQK